MPTKSVEDVMADHTEELLAIEGVVGLYASTLEDGRPCLTIMVVEDTNEVRSKIPMEIEGYPVTLRVSGSIRPLDDEEN